VNLPGRQQPAQRERSVGRVPDFTEPRPDRTGKTVAARRHRCFGGDPSAVDESAVGLCEAVGEAHLPVDELRALRVTHSFQRSEDGCCELACGGDDLGCVRRGHLVVGCAGDDVQTECLAVEEGIVVHGRLVYDLSGHVDDSLQTSD
jgi:hypothetical protein